MMMNVELTREYLLNNTCLRESNEYDGMYHVYVMKNENGKIEVAGYLCSFDRKASAEKYAWVQNTFEHHADNELIVATDLVA